MTTDEILQYAAQNVMPAEEMNCAEKVLFYSMRDIYRAYSSGKISKPEGEAQKAKVLHQFQRDSSDLAKGDRILRHHAEMWQRIELAASHYRLDRTLENADAFIEAVYGVGIKNL